MWKFLKSLVVLVLLVAFLAACNQGASNDAPDGDGGTDAPAGDGEADLGVDRVEFATVRDDAVDLMLVYSTVEKFWPEVGFTEPAEVIITEETVAALVAGEVWVAQADTSQFWAAIDEGDLDLVMVGIDKDNEVRILGSRPGIAGVEDIEPGMTASGGSVGEYDELVLREVLEELGVNPDDLDIISMGGGADARMQAMIAGQLDLGIQQPRNIGPLTGAGGAILYEEAAEVPQEAYFVTREFLNENRAAVCAFLEGRIMGKQWASEGEDMRDNFDEALEIVRGYAVDPTEDEIRDWERELSGNMSLDNGAEIEGLDNLQENLKFLGIVSEEFDWRDHTDFSCLHEAQQNQGLEPRPVE